ncbi:hypothetical protein G6F43_012242 [Rhizopus delemar]|nr:hypothetical protein G6F43_012242 [Rhizopus delemar]
MIQLFEKYGSILEIGLHHTVDGGWFNGRGYVTLVKDKVKSYEPLTPQIPSWEQDQYLHIVWSNMKPICNHCHVDDHTRVNCPVLLRRRKACYICESTQHLKAQCPDAPWNRKRKQVATRHSRVMRTNIELNTEQEPLVLNDTQELDVEMSEERGNKSDNTAVADDKEEFQEAISTFGSVDEESIDGSDLITQNKKDLSQKKIERKETTRRLLHPLVTANNLSMNMQKRNNSEAFTPTSAVERSKKKSALFDDSLEEEENATFEDEYDENNSVPGGYLRQQQLNILLCQETNIPSHSFDKITQSLNMKFQAHQTLWTKYCGILNLNQSQNMELIQQSDDQRSLLVKLTWSDESIEPIFILNLYAPASNVTDRKVFFSNLLHTLHSMNISDTIIQRLFIAGDFNFSLNNNNQHNTRRSNAPHHFLEFLLSQFDDCINSVQEDFTFRPTFRRADSSTCIDYMFASKSFHRKFNNGNVEYMNKEWTDHALLSTNFTVGISSAGKGLWRANPNLAKNPAYIRKLNEQIDQYVTNKLSKYNNTPQEKWDLLKKMVKKVTQNFCRNRCIWRKEQIKQLQSQRNAILRRHSDNPTCLNILLPDVENKLAKLQTEIAEIDILRAGKRWIENNEKSAGYLKRTAESRNIKRNINKIIHPDTGLECLDIKSKLEAASKFYSTLYSAEPINHHDLESMLNMIDKCVSATDAQHIVSNISFDDILDGSRRTPRKSSPGKDGLPYEILNLIISHPMCALSQIMATNLLDPSTQIR